MSFHCPHCDFENSDIQSAGQIQEQGAKYTLTLENMDDFERQVVKSDTAIFRVEDLDIEIPAGRGQLTNVEGILIMVLKDLEADQPRRKREEPELYEKIDAIVQPLVKLMLGTRFPFKISLDDPAGNSWIEPSPDDKGGKYVRTEYARTPEQNAELGLGSGKISEEVEDSAETGTAAAEITSNLKDDVDFIGGEPLIFPSACPGCAKPCQVRMQMVDVPHFKEVVIISVACEHCGYRTSEVKTGGAIPERGRQIILKVLEKVDLTRDVLKSETCTIYCPELKLEITPGTMSGRFTTVEGLLTQVYDTLHSKVVQAGAGGGDSQDPQRMQAWSNLFQNLQAAIKGEFRYQIVLTDPLAGSHIQSLRAPDDDPQLTVINYHRTEEEDEELGLTDMATEMNDQGEYKRAVVKRAIARAERIADESDAKNVAREKGRSSSGTAGTEAGSGPATETVTESTATKAADEGQLIET